MKSVFRILFIFITFIAVPIALPADAVRGAVVDILQIKADTKPEGSFHLEELVALTLGGETTFITGIEIELTIPEELRRLRDSFAVYLYRRIDPQPNTGGMRRYFGESLDYYTLPGTRKMYIQIPLRPDTELPRNPETVLLNKKLSTGDFPLLLMILPVMKGIPSDIYNASFDIKAYPYLADEGILDLTVTAPEGQPYTLRINGRELPYREKGYLLPAGIHELSIESPVYVPVNRSVSVSRGTITRLNIVLLKKEPRINFETPEGTTIFLDGERVSGTSLKVEEGIHTVVFKLGDYSMTREFEVSGGKTYTITLFLDVFVKEH
ncbi:hypothetical protein [Marispirochaeta sp.]|jgi:hypothetical protein|uniref:hypothetical protein n=1 Tax=Marispirochaeta sp. TaxID=2038653 RepID=UPI0029C91529|nr:hypothetical protein [Marispirochaeta sp.]